VSDDSTSAQEVLEALAPLVSVAETLREFGRDPVGFVASIISLYIVDSFLNLGGYVVGSFLLVFDYITTPLQSAENLLVAALSLGGQPTLLALQSLTETVSGVVQQAGPAGPILAAVIAGVFIYVSVRVGVALLGEIPGGSTIVDLLRLR